MATTTEYHKSIYDDFDEVPETPSENASTFGPLSPIVDAVRYAKKEGARDWQRLFGSFQKWTFSSPQRVEVKKKIKYKRVLVLKQLAFQNQAKPSAKVVPMKRRSSTSDDDNDESTSLTPVFERHSLHHSSSELRPPLRYRESIFGSAAQSVDSRASTPSLDESVYLPDRASNAENVQEITPHAYRSPVRPKQVRSTPYTKSRSSDLERLDRLQERLDEIRKIV